VDGKGGGIALFVSDCVKLDLLSFGQHHIDTTVTSHDGIKARYTFVYGEPRPQDRPEFWKLMLRIKDKSDHPWFVAGDFNEALFQHEHFSAAKRSERRMLDFRETLDACNLHDLGFLGLPWTYDNKQVGRKNVRVRLDRAVACPRWIHLFPHATVEHLVSSRSDHCPILINFRTDQDQRNSLPPRYEAMWEREESFANVVEEAWLHQESARNLE
jgi:hypothetical protein